MEASRRRPLRGASSSAVRAGELLPPSAREQASDAPPAPLAHLTIPALPARQRHASAPARRRKQPAPHAATLVKQRLWLAALIVLTIYQLFRNRGIPVLLGPATSSALFAGGWVGGAPARPLTISVYTAPKPFDGADRENQLRAIDSWIDTLAPRADALTIHLLGEANGVAEVCESRGLVWVREVDANFMGVPLFNSIVSVAQRSSSEIVIILNSDIIMFDDFFYTLEKVRFSFGNWTALAARWDVDSLPPANNRDRDAWRISTANSARANGRLHTYGGIDLWVWNHGSNPAPLYEGKMPHFVFGRGKYDNWFTHQAIRNTDRVVADISEACTLVHLTHDHHLVVDQLQAQERPVDHSGLTKSYWSEGKHEKFELFLNSYLSQTFGSYKTQMGTILHAPFKVSSCYEITGLCVFYRRRPHSCRCEYSPFVYSAENDPYVVQNSRAVFCGLTSGAESQLDTAQVEENESMPQIEGRPGGYGTSRIANESVFGMPLLLHPLLLSIVGDSGEAIVVATTATYERRQLLMNFVCNMRRLRVRNFVIAALDDQVYHFAVTRGMPVFLEPTVDSSEGGVTDQEFMRLYVASRIMDHGVDVIFSQVDLVWLRDPMLAYRELDASHSDVGFMTPTSNLELPTSLFVAKVSSNNPLGSVVEELSGRDSRPREEVEHKLFSTMCGENGKRMVRRGSCILPANAEKEQTEGTVMLFTADRLLSGVQQSPSLARSGVFSQPLSAFALHWNDVPRGDDQLTAVHSAQIEHGFGFIDEENDLCKYGQV